MKCADELKFALFQEQWIEILQVVSFKKGNDKKKRLFHNGDM
jgi:hypothetical protein